MRARNIPILSGLGMLAFLLQGCPKEGVAPPCYLNNLVVRNGINASPATDSLRLGDTLFLTASVSRHAWDNANQPIDLNSKGMNSYIIISKKNVAQNEVVQQSDFKLVLFTGTTGETKLSGPNFFVRLNHELVGDSMKLRAGFVPQRKGIYEIKGGEGITGSAGPWFSTAFYKNGSCYQGVLYDSFRNPNRHWYLAYPGISASFNFPNIYYVQFY